MKRILLTTPAVALTAAVLLSACGGGGSGGAFSNGPGTTPGGGGVPNPTDGLSVQLADYERLNDRVDAMPEYNFGTLPSSQTATFNGTAAFGGDDTSGNKILANLSMTVDFAGRGINGAQGNPNAVTGTMDRFRDQNGSIPGSLTTSNTADLKDNEFTVTFSGNIGAASRPVDMLLTGGYSGSGSTPQAISGEILNANLTPSVVMHDGKEYVGSFVTTQR